MLMQCIERCPADLWEAPNPPDAGAQERDPDWNGVERPFWRIAFHDVYFTHLYLSQDEASFQPPPSGSSLLQRDDFAPMWADPSALEPYELAAGVPACRPSELIAYLVFVDGLVDSAIDAMDLESPSSGFRWYPKESKFEHQLLNLRHLQGHVGQLSELQMLRGVNVEWV